jgi:hypothetical protein
LVIRDNEGHFLLIKEAIYQEEITVLNIYTPNVCAPNYIRKTLVVSKA